MSSADGPDVRIQVVHYLARHGWQQGPAGRYGDLWTSPFAQDDVQLAVPMSVGVRSEDFTSLTERLSLRERRDAADIAEDIRYEFLDVQQYRVSDGFVIEDTIDLESGGTLLRSARSLMRAAATTAISRKAMIGGAYSRRGDDIATRARLSHTRPGSFVLPVVMPVGANEAVGALSNSDVFANLTIEPEERRVTRTLATAVTTLNTIAVEPSTEASRDGITELVSSGVSKELVTAVRAISTDPGVNAFDVSFRWATSVAPPADLPKAVTIPADASELLGRLETTLERLQPPPAEVVAGQIIGMRRMPGEPTGEISIRTTRSGRAAEIHITADAATVQAAVDWFKKGQALTAYGEVIALRGRPLIMPSPITVAPLSDVMLDEPGDSA